MAKKAQEITVAGAQNPEGEVMVDLVAVIPHFGYGYGGAEGKAGPVNTGDAFSVNEYRAKRVMDKGLAVLAEDYPPKEVDPEEGRGDVIDQENAQTEEVPNTPVKAAKAKAKAKFKGKGRR